MERILNPYFQMNSTQNLNFPVKTAQPSIMAYSKLFFVATMGYFRWSTADQSKNILWVNNKEPSFEWFFEIILRLSRFI